MKIALWTIEDTARRFTKPGAVQPDWELCFLDREAAPEAAAAAAAGAEILVCDPIQDITGDFLRRAGTVRVIQTEGVGYNRVDLRAAGELGITVCNNAGVNAGAVAEQAVLLMLAVLRRLHEGERAVYEGRQIAVKSEYMAQGTLQELGACRVGLVGMGAIGRETAKRLRPFGAEMVYYDPFPRTPAEEQALGIRSLPLEELLETSDIVTLHLPVTPETQGFLGTAEFGRMKEGAVLINTARGELVDQEALCAALAGGKLAGAGLDTLSPEPVQCDNPVLNLPEDVRERVVLSPHIGGITRQTMERSYANIWENVRRYAAGEPLKNTVFSPEGGDAR